MIYIYIFYIYRRSTIPWFNSQVVAIQPAEEYIHVHIIHVLDIPPMRQLRHFDVSARPPTRTQTPTCHEVFRYVNILINVYIIYIYTYRYICMAVCI